MVSEVRVVGASFRKNVKQSLRGWVYVITNEAMPGMLKVGFTLKDPKLRASELASTGVPLPYRVLFETLVLEPQVVEKLTHTDLVAHKVGKEWFRCSAEIAITAVRSNGSKLGVLLERRYDTDHLEPQFDLENELAMKLEQADEALSKESGVCDSGEGKMLYMQALHLAEQGAIAGYPHAQFCLAVFKIDGIYTKKNTEEGLSLFLKAEQSGHSAAGWIFGRVILRSEGLAHMVDEAIKVLARSRNPMASLELALAYEEGRSVPKNSELALRYRRRFEEG